MKTTQYLTSDSLRTCPVDDLPVPTEAVGLYRGVERACEVQHQEVDGAV